jgi:hypothetical protein
MLIHCVVTSIYHTAREFTIYVPKTKQKTENLVFKVQSYPRRRIPQSHGTQRVLSKGFHTGATYDVSNEKGGRRKKGVEM